MTSDYVSMISAKLNKNVENAIGQGLIEPEYSTAWKLGIAQTLLAQLLERIEIHEGVSAAKRFASYINLE